MKNLVGLIIVTVVFMSCEKFETDENIDSLIALKSVKNSLDNDTYGKHFELNLVGKKNDWNNKEFNISKRHTIFVPKNTDDWKIGPSNPNSSSEPTISGVEILLTQSENFKVIDGTVFDGDKAEFSLGKGEYKVFIAAPGTNNANWYPNDSLIILPETWFYPNDTLFPPWPFDNLVLGEVKVNRTWTDITDLFTINAEEADPLPFDPALGEEQWIFDYFNWLAEQPVNMGDIDGDGIDDIGLYVNRRVFWQLKNKGSQLIKIRFYPEE